MSKIKMKFGGISILLKRLQSQVINFGRIKQVLPRFLEFIKDLKTYSKLPNAEKIYLKNANPRLFDKSLISNVDSHYFYQNLWAFKKIFESNTKYHIDIGSSVNFVGLLTIITQVTFIDIRPLIAKLNNLESKKYSILSLPYEDNSISSLSCLHVAEHIGLGRYGDSLDPLGTKKATKELSRILRKKGNLYFSLPIGKPKLCFNSHRIHSIDQILEYFSKLELVELSGVDDEGNYIINIDKDTLNSCEYGCGFFWFIKK